MKAWHFLNNNGRLGYDDGREVKVGETLSCDGEPELCEHGMHGSVRLIDALRYAPGPILCRVEITGDVIEGEDKIVGRARKVLWMRNIERELHLFACEAAEGALQARIDAGEKTDKRSHAAIQAKRDWLQGIITDDELAAARDAAWDAARAAARDVAWAAARDAARDVAWGAAWDAAWDAAKAVAWAAARPAARPAAWAAAWDAQNERLSAIMHGLGAPE